MSTYSLNIEGRKSGILWHNEFLIFKEVDIFWDNFALVHIPMRNLHTDIFHVIIPIRNFKRTTLET